MDYIYVNIYTLVCIEGSYEIFIASFYKKMKK